MSDSTNLDLGDDPKDPSKRNFLKTALVGSTLGTALYISEKFGLTESLYDAIYDISDKINPLEFGLHLGLITPLENLSSIHAPDLGTPVIYELDGTKTFYLTEGRVTKRYNGMSLDTITGGVQVTFEGQFGFAPNYTGIGSVIRPDKNNPNRLLALAHTEKHHTGKFFPFTAFVGAMESLDNGFSWNCVQTPVITGTDFRDDLNLAKGAGQPSMVLNSSGEIFIYYTNWDPNLGDSICLAKVNERDFLNPDAFEFFGKGDFGKTALPLVKADNLDGHYAALPNVVFNAYLNRLVMVFECNTGFALTASRNGVEWIDPMLIFEFPEGSKLVEGRIGGAIWYSYPSLYLEDGGENGKLLFSRGSWGGVHKPFFMDVTFSKK